MIHDPLPRLVEVPLRAASRQGGGLAVMTADRRRVTLQLHLVARWTPAIAVLPEWYAREKRLLSIEACWDAGQVAARFGRTRGWFLKHRADLFDQGFPQPVCALGRPLWDPQSVRAWFQKNHPLAPASRAANDDDIAGPEQDVQAVDETDAWRAMLGQHYGRHA